MSLFDGLSVIERKECFIVNSEIDNSKDSFFCDWKGQEPFCSNVDLWSQKLKSERITDEEFKDFVTLKPLDINLLSNRWITMYHKIINYKECACISDILYLKKPELICLNFTSCFIFFAKNELEKSIANMNLAPFIDNVKQFCTLTIYNLCEEFIKITNDVLEEEFRISRTSSKLEFFHLISSHEYQVEILEKYPVLAKILTLTLLHWIDNIIDILRCFAQDIVLLKETHIISVEVASIKYIQQNRGDKHNLNKSVSVVVFNNNERLIFKPVSIEVMSSFNRILEFFNDKGFKFKILRILSKNNYGWVEYLNIQQKTDICFIEDYSIQYGQYVGLMYILNGTDIHDDNLVLSDNKLVLIDCETLFTPNISDAQNDEFLKKLNVLQLGILPKEFKFENKQLKTINKLHPILKPNVCDVEKGFELIYDFVLSNRSEFLQLIKSIVNIKIRILLRSTESYNNILNSCLNSYILTNELLRERHLDLLWLIIQSKPQLKDIVASEKQSLMSLDIPFFSANICGNELYSGNNIISEKIISATGIDMLIGRLNSLNNDDKIFQSYLIKSSLTISHKLQSDKRFESGSSTNTTYNLLDGVHKIAEVLYHASFKYGNLADFVSVKSLSPNGNKKFLISNSRLDLFTGLPGEILFFHYYGEIMNSCKYRDHRDNLLSQLISLLKICDLRDLGGFTGWGGILYMFSKMEGTLSLHQRSQIFEMLKNIDFQFLIGNNIYNSLISGKAGFILGALEFAKMYDINEYFEYAIYAGNLLLQQADLNTDLELGWKNYSNSYLSGLSHGNSGFALAFGRLFKYTNNVNYAEIISKILRYENSKYVASERNWLDLRDLILKEYPNKSICSCIWGHGAPGIGLVRNELIKIDKLLFDQYTNDLVVAIETTKNQGFGNRYLNISSGDLGNVELFINYNLYNNTKEFDHLIATVAKSALNQCYNNIDSTLPSGFGHSGFMNGLTGVAYQLLRSKYPNRTTSILTLS